MSLGRMMSVCDRPPLTQPPMCADGASKDVTLDNAGEYVQRVLDVFLAEGVKAQVQALRAGFSTVFPIERLSAFSPEELDVLLNGSRERWEVATIVEHLKFDHGYTRSSRAVGFLLEVICEFNDATLATFLKARAPPARRRPTPSACARAP